MNKFKFLLSPWVVMSGMILGILIGLYFKNIIQYIKPVGEIYLSILQMCVIPIMASAVTISIGKLMGSDKSSNYIKPLFSIFFIFLITVSLFGVIVGLSSKKFLTSDDRIKRAIGNLMVDNEGKDQKVLQNSTIQVIDTRFNDLKDEKHNGIVEFIRNIIPDNIFSSLALGEKLRIIFFFILFGFMMKYMSKENSENLLILFEGVFQAFQKIIKMAMYFLPFGLCAMIATQFSILGVDILSSLLKLIIIIYAAAICIFIISFIIIGIAAKVSNKKQFNALSEVVLICVGACDSFATIPSAIEGLSKDLNLDEDKINLSLPLSITLCKYGNLLVFSIVAVFATQLYDYKLGFFSVIIIIFTSILASIAGAGSPSVIAIAMISMILNPLNVPSGAIVVMLIALDSIIDPAVTLINVYPNCAASALFAKRKDKIK